MSNPFECFLNEMEVIHENHRTFVRFRNVLNQSGTSPRFEIKGTRPFEPANRLLAMFHEQWTDKKVEKVLGKGMTIVFDKENKTVFSMTKGYMAYVEEVNKDIADKTGGKTIQEIHKTMKDNDIIFDPTSEEAKALKGRYVLASNIPWNFEKTAVRRFLYCILEDTVDGKPFLTSEKGDETTGNPCEAKPLADADAIDGLKTEEINPDRTYFCIKAAPAPQIQPYRLADPAVRDKLMMRIARSKDSKNFKEFMITSFTCDNYSWKVNGYSATALLDKFVWMDGTPCGEFPKEEA